MLKLNLHFLRSLACSNCNRGKDGMPKMTNYGGHQRGRWSSQSINAQVRQALKDKFDSLCGIRTREIGCKVKVYIEQNKEKYPDLYQQIDAVSVAVPRLFGSMEKTSSRSQILHVPMGVEAPITRAIDQYRKSSKEKFDLWLDPKEAILAVADGEIPEDYPDRDAILKKFPFICSKYEGGSNNFIKIAQKLSSTDGPEYVNTILKSIKDEEDPKAFVKGIKTTGRTGSKENKAQNKEILEFLKKDPEAILDQQLLDAALWGRQEVQGIYSGVDGSIITSHAITVNAARPEPDYFTARDDEVAASQAAFMQTKYFVSGTFYQYFSLDIEGFKRNFQGLVDDPNLLRNVVSTILTAMYEQVPGGMQLKTGSNVRPDVMLIEVIHKGEAFSYAKAFERPIKAVDGGYMDPAARQLARQATCEARENPNIDYFWVSHTDVPCDINIPDRKNAVKVFNNSIDAIKEIGAIIVR